MKGSGFIYVYIYIYFLIMFCVKIFCIVNSDLVVGFVNYVVLFNGKG